MLLTKEATAKRMQYSRLVASDKARPGNARRSSNIARFLPRSILDALRTRVHQVAGGRPGPSVPVPERCMTSTKSPTPPTSGRNTARRRAFCAWANGYRGGPPGWRHVLGPVPADLPAIETGYLPITIGNLKRNAEGGWEAYCLQCLGGLPGEVNTESIEESVLLIVWLD